MAAAAANDPVAAHGLEHDTTIRKDAIVIEGGGLKGLWVLGEDQVQNVDGDEFIKLSTMDRKLAAYCGANLKSSHPLSDNAFLYQLITDREEAIEMEMSKLSETFQKKPRKEMLEHLPKVILVNCEFDGAAMPIKMIVPTTGQESPSVHLDPDVLAFIRLGVAGTLGVASGMRAKPRKLERFSMEGYPNVSAKKQRPSAVFTRYRNIEGSSQTHWERWVPSDVDATNEERKRTAVQKCQGFFADNNYGSDDVDDEGLSVEEVGADAENAAA
jgi:hypothetical protein